MDTTIEYYNQNADQFVQDTLSVNFIATQERFLKKIPSGSRILDFGCGSGRDTKYFLEKGYQVTATDGSEEICRLASVFTGIEVKKMLFQELNASAEYDGIWACSSILHLSKSELLPALRKMCVALKDHGVIYTSFKYGSFEGKRNGRYFTDFTESSFQNFIDEIPELSIENCWITGDARPGRGEEKWLNLILRKWDIR